MRQHEAQLLLAQAICERHAAVPQRCLSCLGFGGQQLVCVQTKMLEADRARDAAAASRIASIGTTFDAFDPALSDLLRVPPPPSESAKYGRFVAVQCASDVFSSHARLCSPGEKD